MKFEKYGCKNSKDKIGVLIGQLGTPDAPTKKALRPYLKQFLSDRRVIEKNKYLWWLILNGIILNVRPKKSAKLYKRIWGEKSPLLDITEKSTQALEKELKKVHSSIEVVFGMRYGKPSLEKGIDELIERGCKKILLFNMYPQYSAATSASNYDAVFKHLLKRRIVPTLRVAEPYYVNPNYIDSLAFTVNEFLNSLEVKPEYLVLSYHGIPEEYVEKGDPYCCMCTETTEALLPHINFPREKIIHTYQSRFGKDPWLVPYTDETIKKLGEKGVKRIALAAPGFTADCLETLDELGNEGEEEFIEAGGEHVDLVPCLNDHPHWVRSMKDIIISEIDSWLKTAERSSKNPCNIACPVLVEKKAANS